MWLPISPGPGPAGQGFLAIAVEGHHPPLAPLAGNGGHPVLQVHIIDVDRRNFKAPDAGGPEKAHNGAVADSGYDAVKITLFITRPVYDAIDAMRSQTPIVPTFASAAM